MEEKPALHVLQMLKIELQKQSDCLTVALKDTFYFCLLHEYMNKAVMFYVYSFKRNGPWFSSASIQLWKHLENWRALKRLEKHSASPSSHSITSLSISHNLMDAD